MPTYSVRSIFQWSPFALQRKKHVYEERITLWQARTIHQAIELAEREADKYALNHAQRLGLLHGYELVDDCKPPKQGIEVFSLLRESDLPPKAYLKTFFDTGDERQGDYDADQSESPKSGASHGRRSPVRRKRSGQ